MASALTIRARAATPLLIKKRRGRPRIKEDNAPQLKLLDKLTQATHNHPGVPAVYASTTKGGMKLVYEGHHFRYSYRKGQYSIFQCCYKENKEECKVKVVSDQKRVYPLEGEHVHFVQATDKSVTEVTFQPGKSEEPKTSVIDVTQYTIESRELDSKIAIIDNTHQTIEMNDEIDQNMESYEIYEQTYLKAAEEDESNTQGSTANDTSSAAPDVINEADDPNDFREKIKKRLQKALMESQVLLNSGPKLFIYSRKGGILLVHHNFIYRSNLKRFGKNCDKIYWECVHNRSSKCRSRLKTVGEDLYITNETHNHKDDGPRIEFARQNRLLIYKKLDSIGLFPKQCYLPFE